MSLNATPDALHLLFVSPEKVTSERNMNIGNVMQIRTVGRPSPDTISFSSIYPRAPLGTMLLKEDK